MADGGRVSGYLPGWAQDDPSVEGLTAELLGVHLVDIVHTATFGGVRLPVVRGSGPEEPAVVLAAHIQCRPYDDDPASRLPLAHLHLADDVWVQDLDPARLGDVAAVLRAQADLLEQQVRPALEAARADWRLAHTTPRAPGAAAASAAEGPVSEDNGNSKDGARNVSR